MPGKAYRLCSAETKNSCTTPMIDHPSSTFEVKRSLFDQQFEPWRKKYHKEYSSKGIYILKTSVTVPRKLAIDSEAILYIGYGDVLNKGANRLIHLVDALNGPDVKHKAGVAYNNHAYYRYYPLETLSLYVELTTLQRTMGHELLEGYQRKVGELRLLNQVTDA